MLKFWQYFLVTLFIFPLYFLIPKIVSADWSMPRYDFDKTGVVPYQITEKPQEKWVSGNIGFVWNAPVVDSNGNIYINTNGITSLDKNGQVRWVTHTTQPYDSVVLDNNNNIYYSAAGYPATVYSYDQNGNKRWEYSLGGWGGNNIPTGVALSRNKDTLYVGIAYPSKTVLALNTDGSFRWQKSLNYTPVSTPIVALDGTIYVGIGSTGYLYAFSDTGIIKWYRYVGIYDVHSLMLDSSNNIYLKSSSENGGIIVSYDSLGNKRWVYQYPIYSLNREEEMALKDNMIYAISDNNLIAVNTSGNLIWKWTAPIQISQRLRSPAVDKDGNIYTTYGNKLYVLNPDGTLKWEIPFSYNLQKLIIADNNLIYVYHNPQSTWNGYLHALGKITPDKTPVIFIPGIGGSELKVKNDTVWSKDDGHGGVYNHAYLAGEKVWVNEGEGANFGDDDYFDILRMKDDGINSEAGLELTGDIYAGSYQQTINFFTNNGYTLNQDLFVFPYDWRKDIALTAPLLDQKIDAVKTQTGATKVDIVAHSMGGLVARNYIADATKAGKVRKLINLGVPHLGAVEFLKDLRYGGCLSKVNLEPFCIGISPSEIKDVIRNMIAGYELAPSQKYYEFYDGSDNNRPLPFVDNRDIDNNEVTGLLNYQQFKTTLTNLGHNTTLFTPTETFHALDNNLAETNGVEVNVISGSGKATLGQIIEDYYLNFAGLKIPKTDMRNINGDGTVPLYSSALKDGSKSLLGSAKIFYTNQKHPDLVADGSAMNLVKNILVGDNNLPAGISTQPFNFSGTGLSVHSPVLINAYDESNNHTGPLANGDYEENIPGSSYEVIGDAKFVWLPDNGIYDINFEATDQGSFDFKIRTYENDANSKTIVYNNIPLTTQTTAEAVFDTSSTNPPLISLDVDGNGVTDAEVGSTGIVTGAGTTDSTAPETSISLTGELNNDGSYKTDVTVELSAIDNSAGVAKIEYSLDNGQSTITYTGSFTLSDNATTKIKYRSIDNAGNEENPKEKDIIINKPATSSGSNSNSGSEDNNNQTTVADEVKKVVSNILNFNNEENNNNNQISENNDSEVLGAKTENKNSKNNNINPLVFLPLIILGGFIIYRKRFKS
ncbi:MAG: hypothetical protein Q7R97_05135 [Candidatus Daviesbacteria bacterium]|nr:hypothetical protein [Candidatus Daviesbacteria bacterium]